MKIATILKFVWLFTAALAIGIAIRNYFAQGFTHHVFIPLLISLFLIYKFYAQSKNKK